MDRLEVETRRLYQRYVVEVVEALGLCPWARRARLEGRVEIRVSRSTSLEPSAEECALVEQLAGLADCEIGILLLPCLAMGRAEFERRVARLRDAHTEAWPRGQAPWAFAAFHPDAPLDLGDAERLVPFLRRTPDPTVQLVRLDVLERVREGTPQGTAFVDLATVDEALLSDLARPTLRQRIASGNLETLRRAGPEAVEALLSDLRRDRDRTHALLAAEGALPPAGERPP